MSILRRKGRVLDAISDGMRALRSRLGSQDQAVIGKLNDVSSKLSALVLAGPSDGDLGGYRKQLDGLVKEREEIEDQISRLGAGYLPAGKPITFEAVRNAIPEDAALLEFALYHPVSPKTFEFSPESSEDRAKLPAHYVAYVLHHSGEPKRVDLGEAVPIDGAIRDLRNAVRDPKRSDVVVLSRRLDEKVMARLRPIVGNSKHLLISSDGELNLVPFEAMVAENGKFLIENYDITYLTSGRDLLRIGSGRELSGPPLIIANPAYGLDSGSNAAETIARNAAPTRRRGRSVTITRSISETFFTPLSGTAQEARAIKKLFPDSTLLEGPRATKASIKAAVAPRLLHIATHGFFLTEDGPKSGAYSGAKGTAPGSGNPLARSGLALAGANRHDPNNSDGILSALEASGLDLWGTKLVVLSACDTGFGEVKTGEGVYGLRRSFIEAGAESLVMSLWPVSDSVTRQLMIGYYKNLKQGMGRGEALRQVQLEMLKTPERRHPFYWASFIESGDWRTIR
jgi:CHAT domain-containing protein